MARMSISPSEGPFLTKIKKLVVMKNVGQEYVKRNIYSLIMVLESHFGAI